MKKRIFLTALLVIFLNFLSGCTENIITENKVKSFQGIIDSIEDNNTLYVECSSVIIERNSEGIVDTMARFCSVKINKDTVIIGKSKNSLKKKSLKEGQVVEVILKKPKEINEDVNSRKVVAKEIKILNEEIK
jgi:hypothetical protein